MEALPLAAAMIGGLDVSAAVILGFPGSFERNVVRYECEGLEPFAVDYINASPNFLAIVPVGPDKLVFVATIAASGVKYVSGQYEWWTRGGEVTFTDLMADGDPIACLEINETP